MEDKVQVDQAILFHFACKKNERVYQVILEPGAPWQDISEVLEDFKSEFQRLQQQALEAENKVLEEKKDNNECDSPICVEIEESNEVAEQL